MIATLIVIGLAFGFVALMFIAEIVFDLLYQLSPGFRRWYRDFYNNIRG